MNDYTKGILTGASLILTLVLGQTPHYQNHERMIRFPDVTG